MSDQQFIDALQQIFDANDPLDGIDRHDGYGRDYRITALRVMPSDDGFDDLEVTVRMGPETVTSRLLFDRAWREASGMDDPRSYAIFVAGRWRFSSVEVVPDVDPAGDGEVELWQFLQASLGATAAGVNQTGHGVLEVVEEDGDVVTIHVTPQQWRRFAAGRNETAFDELDELIASRWDDEHHVVFFRGAFHSSIRAELPPVRSSLVL